MRNLIVIILTLFIVPLTMGQLLHYDVVKGDKIIGGVDMLRTRTDSIETISIESIVEFKIIFSFHVDFALNETFQNGKLISGTASNMLNDISQKESIIEKKENDYRLVLNGTPNRLSNTNIDYSISEVYIREPKHMQKAFSQHFGTFMHFERIKDHTYKLVSPDGENYYTYENGYCTEVKIYRDYANYSLKMRPESYALVKYKADSLRSK